MCPPMWSKMISYVDFVKRLLRDIYGGMYIWRGLPSSRTSMMAIEEGAVAASRLEDVLWARRMAERAEADMRGRVAIVRVDIFAYEVCLLGMDRYVWMLDMRSMLSAIGPWPCELLLIDGLVFACGCLVGSVTAPHCCGHKKRQETFSHALLGGVSYDTITRYCNTYTLYNRSNPEFGPDS
jgi:hypothetical protein